MMYNQINTQSACWPRSPSRNRDMEDKRLSSSAAAHHKYPLSVPFKGGVCVISPHKLHVDRFASQMGVQNASISFSNPSQKWTASVATKSTGLVRTRALSPPKLTLCRPHFAAPTPHRPEATPTWARVPFFTPSRTPAGPRAPSLREAVALWG